MKRYIPLLFVMFAMTLAGCRSTRHAVVAPELEPAPEPQLLERTVVGFSASVDGIDVNGQLRMVQDSALWLSVSKLIELGRGLATTDSVWVSAPMMDVSFAGTYVDLSRRVGRTITFDALQRMALADDAEAQLTRLATELGFNATVRITSRRKVDSLSLPFRKPKQ